MTHKFAPNWTLILILVLPVWAVVLFIVWEVTFPALRSVIFDLPFPLGWTWFTIILADFCFMTFGFIAIWGVVSGFLTEITETYIRRRLLFRHKEIKLREVKQFRIRNYRIEMTDERQKFTLSLMFYKNPEEVLSFIKSRIQFPSGLN